MSQIENFTISTPRKNQNRHSGNASIALVSTYRQNESDTEVERNGKISNSHILKLYAVSDLLGLFLGFLVASIVADSSQILSFLAVSAGVLLWFERNGHYRVRTPFWSETKNVVSTLGFALLVDSFFQPASDFSSSRLLIIASWILASAAIIGFRLVVRQIATKQGSFEVPTLIVGSGATAQQAQAAIESAPEMGYKIVGQIKNLPEAFLHAGSSWTGLCKEYGAKHIVIALDDKDMQGAEKIIAKLMYETIDFSVVPALLSVPVAGMVPQYFMNHNTMLMTRDSGLKQYLPQLAKRSVDVLVSASALLLLSPVILVISLLIKLDGGDAFFGHKRLGRDGKVFPCLKFRSMVMGGDKILKKHLEENPEAAEEWKANQKLQNDPRVTALGRFLRKTSIDELPQLINVLKGDMSLVGPRPIVRDEIEHYNQDIAYYYRVRPGVTGLWQVSGRNDVSYAQRVQMDSWYVRNWSLWHDIAIICKTFPAVFKRSGAY